MSLRSCTICCRPHAKSSDTYSHRRDSVINKQLREWRKTEEKSIKLLLLGCGESGKSTISKQMRIIHINGFSDGERLERIENIRKNVRDSILSILGAMSILNIELEDKKLQASRDWILNNCTKDSFDYSKIFYEHVIRLWEDEGVQKCFQRSNEYQLIDSAKYFFERLGEIQEKNYSPSDQDMLRCRVITNSIHNIDFCVKDGKSSVHFNVYDVGGQRGQRRKWLQVFDCITALIFVLDASSYDLTLREDNTKNRMLEACDLFHQIWNNRWLQRVPVILFINKIDILEEKVKSGRTLDSFIEQINVGDRFYKYFKPYSDFCNEGIKDSEMKEFVESIPLPGGERPRSSTLSIPGLHNLTKRRSRQISFRHSVDGDVIKTAVFIKRVFMDIVNEPRFDEYGGNWHSAHDCEYYYTCAVDTQQIEKVLDSCRSLIIKKHLHGWGLSL